MILDPEAMHVIRNDVTTFDLRFGQKMRDFICCFSRACSSISRIEGGNDWLVFSSEEAGASVVVVIVETVVPPVLARSDGSNTRGCFGVGSLSLWQL